MTYRDNAKPERVRRVDWGAVGARALRCTLRMLEIAVVVACVVVVVRRWRFALTHIGSSKSAELVVSWVVVAWSTIASVVATAWLWDIGPEGRRSGRDWYHAAIKRPVFEEREL